MVRQHALYEVLHGRLHLGLRGILFISVFL
jgi:hypothetical protein